MIFNIDDVKTIYETLISKGVKFKLPPTLRQSEGILLTVTIDPDGLEASFAQYCKKLILEKNVTI